MNYNFNNNRFVKLVLASFERTAQMVAWAEALTAPLATIYALFTAMRVRLNSEAVLNGQTGVLEWTLNSRFDPTQRRIRIVTLVALIPIKAYLQSENKPRLAAYLQSENQAKMQTGEYSEYSSGDFLVKIPADLDGQQTAIRRLTDKYRLASKTYSVVIG